MATIIPPGLTRACLQLEAIDDEIVEDNELFMVIIEAVNPSDSVNGTTSLTIYDNDGKCIHVILYLDFIRESHKGVGSEGDEPYAAL